MNVFSSLALVFGLAAGGGVIARFFKQPALLGYVLAGVILTSSGRFNQEELRSLLELMGQLGVTLLLFLVGLELPISELKKMGKVALATGLGQIIFTSGAGFLVIKALGYPAAGAVYMSIALAFSSTIIIIKLLSEKKDLHSLYGRIAVGSLLIQDFVAIGFLVMLSGLGGGGFEWSRLLLVAIKGVGLVVITMFLASRVFPRLMGWLARSTELVFVGSMAWCLMVAAAVASPFIGFGIEIGGFLAGLAMANTPEHLQILSRIKPLRDFFLTLFFVWLGAGLGIHNLGNVWLPALVLSAFVLVVNPIIMMSILGILGYKKRTSFLAGLTVAQISEFSLILMALALKVGHVTDEMLTLVTIVGVVTMTTSTYMIMYSDALYKRVSRYLGIFERKNSHEKIIEDRKELKDHIVLFGHSRTGSVLFPVLNKLSEVVIVDFNPSVVDELKGEGKNIIYGDMSDVDLYEDLGLSRAKMVVSTVPDVTENLQLLETLREKGSDQIVVTTARDVFDTERLYEKGADLVIIPEKVGGLYLAGVFEKVGMDREKINNIAKKVRES